MTDVLIVAAIERADAATAAAMAGALADLDPRWGSSAQPLGGGGWLVLSGKGLYVNRAIAAGIDAPLTDDELDLIVDASHAAGVTPSIDVTPATHPDTVMALDRHGSRAEVNHTIAVLSYPRQAELPAPATDEIAVAPVSARSLDEWIDTSIAGWGHETLEARRAADAFARAAHSIDGDGMVIAIDSREGVTFGEPIGCASLTIHDRIASLGGMSTIPSARRRGVQSALIRHRLDVAHGAGALTIWSSAVAGGDSQRNLLRNGFEPLHLRTTYVAADGDR